MPGYPVAHRRGVEFPQSFGDERSQSSLGYTFGQGVYRCESLFEILRLLGTHAPVFRMHDLESEGSAPHLAETTDPLAAR